jgi:hypothetical protein
MIDTITLNVNDLLRHKALVNFLDNKLKPSGTTRYVKEMTDDDNTTIEQKRIMKSFINFHDTHRLIEVAHFNNLQSWHYDINYYIDYSKDRVRFDFSLPKYIFGTNVYLMLPSPFSKNFSYSYHSELKNALYHNYTYLFKAIDRFFMTEFVEIPIDWGHVTISRVDICYNQLFPDKNTALEYLKLTKKIKKKGTRETSNMSRTWETSNYTKTQRYAFKIYHKGSEFRKHDFPKLLKFKQQGKYPYDLEAIQAMADRTLRYEMTFRNSYMSYLYMNHLFRKDCEIWNYCKERYRQNKAKKESKKYTEWRKSLTRDDKKSIDFGNYYIHKTKDFYVDQKYLTRFNLETNYEDYQQFYQRNPPNYRPAFFSPDLWDLMTNAFLDACYQYKFETIPSKHSILKKIDEHNEKAVKMQTTLGKYKVSTHKIHPAKKIQKSKIAMVLELLDQYEYDEIPKLNLFNRQTWYSYRKTLEYLGYHKNAQLPLNVPCKFDLQNYYTAISYNSRNIPNLNFFRQ